MKRVLSLFIVFLMAIVITIGTTMATSLDQAVAKGKVTIVGRTGDPVGLVIWDEAQRKWVKSFSLVDVKLQDSNVVENSFLLTRLSSTVEPTSQEVISTDIIAESTVLVKANVSNQDLAKKTNVKLTIGGKDGQPMYTWNGTMYELSQGVAPSFEISGLKKVTISMCANDNTVSGEFTYSLEFTSL